MRHKIKKSNNFKNSKQYLKMINDASVYDVAIVSPITFAKILSIKLKNDAKPRGVILPKYEPIWITPEPIQARFQFLERHVPCSAPKISNVNPMFYFGRVLRGGVDPSKQKHIEGIYSYL